MLELSIVAEHLIVPYSGGSITVTGRDIEGMLTTWLDRGKQLTKPKLRALHDGHVLLQQPANSSSAAVKGERMEEWTIVLCLSLLYSIYIR